MKSLSKDELFNFLDNFFSNEKKYSTYFPDLTKISLIINLSVICNLFSAAKQNETEFKDACKNQYYALYNNKTQINENKYLSILFEITEFSDERSIFDIMNSFVDILQDYELNIDDLKEALIELSIKYCNEIKLGTEVYSNLISIAYLFCDNNKKDTFYNTCSYIASEGKKFIDKNKLLLQKNDSKSSIIEKELSDAIDSQRFSEKYFNKNISGIDTLFVLIIMASVCLDFAEHQLNDFLELGVNSFNKSLDKENANIEFCSNSEYIGLIYEPPNYCYIYDIMKEVSYILKNNYNTNRMVDLSYSLLDLAAIYSNNLKLDKFKFVKYCYTIFNNRPTLHSHQRIDFEKEIDAVINLYAPLAEIDKSIIEISKDTITNKTPNTLN